MCLAVVVTVGWLAPHLFRVLKENLQSNPDGWHGVIPLAVVMGLASLLLILICALIAGAVGFLLQIVIGSRGTPR